MLKWFLSGILALIVIMAAPVVWVLVSDPPPPPADGQLPWQIDLIDHGQTRVFGLVPGISTLDDGIARLGSDFTAGILHTDGEAQSFEAYFESASAGFITGKFILTIDIPKAELAAMAARTPSVKMLETGARLLSLHSDDIAAARTAAIGAIAFIPSADLDEDVILQRFGPPGLRIRASPQLEHFLYPDKGLDIALDTRGKEVLQYVAPAAFERLLEPLHTLRDDHPAEGPSDSAPEPRDP